MQEIVAPSKRILDILLKALHYARCVVLEELQR